MKKKTIVDVAKRTGYSISTVSRVLSGQAKKYRISDKTSQIILVEAKKCDYQPSLVAKSLRTNKTQTIGLVVPSIDNPFFANIASLIIAEAKAEGYTVILADSMENETDEHEAITSLVSRNVDGMMVAPSGQDAAYLEKINDSGLPVILIDRFFEETTIPFVTTDNYKGAVDAVNHLIHEGHRKIACIQGVPHSTPVKERVKGYRDAIQKNNLGEYMRVTGNSFSIQNGYIETKLLLSSNDPPTAIFTLSNTILLGALKAIHESLLRVPVDISIVSFDNNTYLDFMNPSITRVCQPVEAICAIALKVLLQNIKTKEKSSNRIILPPNLLIRNSVCKLSGLNV